MTFRIYNAELIVGNQTSNRRFGLFYPEMAWKWIEDELDTFHKRAESFLVTPEKQRTIREILKYWKGKNVRDRIFATLPGKLKEAIGDAAFLVDLHLFKGTGHFIIDYEKVLNYGLKKVIEESRKNIESLDISENTSDLEKLHFLNAVIIVCEAAITFAGRFADKAESMAKTEKNTTRRKELERITMTCRHVPGNPARNFFEAIQSFWFIKLIPHIDNDGTAIEEKVRACSISELAGADFVKISTGFSNGRGNYLIRAILTKREIFLGTILMEG
jgi:pyruvate-formate lyase